jgi:hypothetical protein
LRLVWHVADAAVLLGPAHARTKVRTDNRTVPAAHVLLIEEGDGLFLTRSPGGKAGDDIALDALQLLRSENRRVIGSKNQHPTSGSFCQASSMPFAALSPLLVMLIKMRPPLDSTIGMMMSITVGSMT